MKSNFSVGLALAEIIASVLFYYIVSWKLIISFSDPNIWQSLLIYFFGALVAYYILYLSPKYHKISLGDSGVGQKKYLFIKTDNIRIAAKVYATALCFGVIALVVIALLGDREIIIPSVTSIVLKFIFYIMSASIQDVIFFVFLLKRIQIVIDYYIKNTFKIQITVVVLSALLFSAFHYPNSILMLYTLLFGLVIFYVYSMYPNLFLIVLLHASFGTFLHRIYQMNMRIGIFYYNPDLHIARKLLPYAESLIGDMW